MDLSALQLQQLGPVLPLRFPAAAAMLLLATLACVLDALTSLRLLGLPLPLPQPWPAAAWRALGATVLGYALVMAAQAAGAPARGGLSHSRAGAARRRLRPLRARAPGTTPAAAAAPATPTATAPPSHVAAALRAIALRRLRDGSGGGGTAVAFAPRERVLPYPFEAVLAALKGKFRPPSDPLNPSIREVRLLHEATACGAAEDASEGLVIHEAVEDVTAAAAPSRPLGAAEGDPVTLRRRELVIGMKEAGLPAALRWAMPDCVVLEERTVAAHVQRACLVTLTTQEAPGGGGLGRLHDQSLYFADPSDAARTIFIGHMDLQSTSMVVARLLAQLQPAAGAPAPDAPATLAEPHIRALLGRLLEMFGEPVSN